MAQQSGIRSGDGGFDITVQGKTQLTGGVISTTEAGVKAGNNKISSAGGITTQDIQNSASYTAESSQLTLGTSAGSSSAGYGNESGSAASTTQAGISGITGNQTARTGDAETGINKIFNQQAVADNVNAQVQITQTAGQQVPKATATAMDKQANDLMAQANTEPDSAKKKALLDEAAKYKEGGSYRIAAHTVFGALSGGAGGAAAAGTVAYNAQNLNDLQDQLAKSLTNAGVEEKTAKAIANVTFNAGTLAAGNAVGGSAGATAALNVDANNRQLHPDQIKRIQKLSSDPKKQAEFTAALCVLQNCDIDGLSGYDSNGKAVYETGRKLQTNNPELFKQLVQEINNAGLLSGQFAYPAGGWDFSKDAIGKNVADKVQAAKDAWNLLSTPRPTDLSNVGKGFVKGLANNVKDAPQYPIDNQDEKAGALLANTALVVGPGAVAGVEGTLNAMGRVWEAGKVLNAGEIAMSNGGNISAQQMTRMGTPAALDTIELSKLGTLDSLNPTAAGTLRETVSNSYFERNGFKTLDGKCGSNCFDGVYIKGDQVIVNEVKPLNADGSIQLNGPTSAGLPTQGTIQWVESRAQALIDTKDPVKMQTGYMIMNAKNAGNLTTVVSGVNANGMVVVKVKP